MGRGGGRKERMKRRAEIGGRGGRREEGEGE